MYVALRPRGALSVGPEGKAKQEKGPPRDDRILQQQQQQRGSLSSRRHEQMYGNREGYTLAFIWSRGSRRRKGLISCHPPFAVSRRIPLVFIQMSPTLPAILKYARARAFISEGRTTG